VARYRLLSEDGDDLGPFIASASIWAEGDTIPLGRTSALTVVRVVPALPKDEFAAYLVVKEETV
jgi:hypothetical protein